jgi:hypothetical protein
MELGRGQLIVGALIAITVGAWLAWSTRSPPGEAPPPAGSSTRAVTVADRPARLYKWQDDNGVWNYTDRPPAGRAYEEVRGTPNVTPVPTVVPEVPGTTAASGPPAIPPPPED